ncbi:MAG: M14 family zinc carboxypeptidase [Lacibacter sp.]
MKTKRLSRLLLVYVFFQSVVTSFSQQLYSEVQIRTTRQQLSRLFEMGLSVDHFSWDEKGTSIFATVNQDDLEILRRSGVSFKVLEKDAVAAFLRRNRREDPYMYDDRKQLKPVGARLFFESPDQPHANIIQTPAAFLNPPGSMGGYYTLAEVYTQINNLRTNYPNLVRIDTIGWTFGGNRTGAATPRPIWVVKISDNVNVDEPAEAESLITGLTHAREGMSMMNIIFFMQYLTENYATNPRIKELVDNRQMYFIPVVNPDGYVYNQVTNPSGGGMHRKNRNITNNTNNIGVDLNRNFEVGWDEIGIGGSSANPGSSTTPTNDTYRGPSAMSELESQAIRNFLRGRRIKAALNHHSYAEAHIHVACVPSVVISAADSAIIRNLSAQMTKYNTYVPGNPFTAIGAVARGSFDDYYYAGDLSNRGKIYSFTPEIGPDAGGIGGSSFWPVQSQIIPLSKAIFHTNYQAVLSAGAYTRVENRTPHTINLTTGSFQFRVYRMGLVDSATTVSIIPLENIQSVGSPVTITSLSQYLSFADGSISYVLNPAITNGARIRFVWRTVTGGITQTDTVTRYFNGNITGVTGFFDNMESGTISTNWVVSSGWNYSTATMAGSGAYSGTRSLAESPAQDATYPANANLTARINRVFNFSGITQGYLSFWFKARTENGQDYFRVEVSTNNGSTWNAVSGRKTIVENVKNLQGIPSYTGIQDVWVQEQIDLTPFAGQSNVQIRFRFVSNGSNQNDGVFIDDVAVVTSSSALTTLPVEFVTVSAKLSDGKVRIDWEAVVDDEHEMFEVERAGSGGVFQRIGVVRSGGKFFHFTDANPAVGINQYRIKQIDKNGSFRFSKTVTINMADKMWQVKVYPTVATTQLRVSWAAPRAGLLQAEVFDNYGRLLRMLQQQVASGNGLLHLSVADLPAGTYYLKISNEAQQLLTVERFVKQ